MLNNKSDKIDDKYRCIYDTGNDTMKTGSQIHH